MVSSDFMQNNQNQATAQMPQAPSLPNLSPNPQGGAAGFRFAKLPKKTLINLRGEDKIKTRLAELFGAGLPVKPNQVIAIGARRALWLGPDETLLMLEETQEADFLLSAKNLLAGSHYAATLVSNALSIFHLGGKHCRDVLAKGCGLDLHPEYFVSGMCAQSMLGHAAVTLSAEEDGSILLFCRNSFSDYIICWLKDAGLETGYVFSEQ